MASRKAVASDSVFVSAMLPLHHRAEMMVYEIYGNDKAMSLLEVKGWQVLVTDKSRE